MRTRRRWRKCGALLRDVERTVGGRRRDGDGRRRLYRSRLHFVYNHRSSIEGPRGRHRTRRTWLGNVHRSRIYFFHDDRSPRRRDGGFLERLDASTGAYFISSITTEPVLREPECGAGSDGRSFQFSIGSDSTSSMTTDSPAGETGRGLFGLCDGSIGTPGTSAKKPGPNGRGIRTGELTTAARGSTRSDFSHFSERGRSPVAASSKNVGERGLLVRGSRIGEDGGVSKVGTAGTESKQRTSKPSITSLGP